MISVVSYAEQDLLRKYKYKGGKVCEFGPWLGQGSTQVLLDLVPAKNLIIVDNFIWQDWMNESNTRLKMKPGDCFYQYFYESVRNRDFGLTIEVKDMRVEPISLPELEMVFLDSGKTFDCWKNVMLSICEQLNGHLYDQDVRHALPFQFWRLAGYYELRQWITPIDAVDDMVVFDFMSFPKAYIQLMERRFWKIRMTKKYIDEIVTYYKDYWA